MALTPEGQVKKQLKSLAKAHKAIYHVNTQGFLSNVGFPDNLVVRVGGETAYVEVKRFGAPLSALTPLQQEWRRKLIQQGAPYFFFNGTQTAIEECTQWLRGGQYVRPTID